MDVNLIEFTDEWVAAQYEENGLLHRRWVPRSLVSTATKGPARIPRAVILAGLEFSDVDLVEALGPELPAIDTAVLQDRLRRDGLWTKDDYAKGSRIIAGIVQRMRGADVATVINAAITGGK